MNKKIKKEMRDYQIAKQNVESFYASQQTWNQEEDLKKSDSSRDKLTGSHQNENWWLLAFLAIPAKQECISTHKVRAQLGIEDDILRGLGMCLQQAKCSACTQGHCLLTCEATTIAALVRRYFKKRRTRWKRRF